MDALKHLRFNLSVGPRKPFLKEMPKRSICGEIGVHQGKFARNILDFLDPVHLHLIDPWKHFDEEQYKDSLYGGLGPAGQKRMDDRYLEVKKRFRKEIDAGQVHIHRELSSTAVGHFDDHYFDWIYIDANHQYEFVLQDLQLYYPKVKPGGLLTGDDYGARGWWGNGVQEAVTDFVAANSDLTLKIIGEQFIMKKGAVSRN